MKYAVTYCTMDREVGSNPLWHSFLLFSIMDTGLKQLQVVDNWGFYGVPATDEPNSWTNKLKAKLGVDVDFHGNHGMLRREEIRYLDRGYGLHGVTFELTRNEFELLHNKCITMAQEQENAIMEVVNSQGIKGKSSYEKIRMYPHEQYSKAIYALEKIKADQQGRESRLKPFEIQLRWGLKGPDTSKSFNCKSQVLELLALVLSKDQLERLSDEGQHPTIPILSGPMESIFLHSTGPLYKHTKASGETVYYRNGQNSEVKLYWTLPPQELEVLSEESINLLEIDAEYVYEAKATIRKLQSLEWLLRNAVIPFHYQKYQLDLITRVVALYKEFSIIEAKPQFTKKSNFGSFFYSLVSAPYNEEQKRLHTIINQAKLLFNSLYMSIVDGWVIDNNYPSETSAIHFERANPLEALASYLSIEDQKNLCRIIGRTYCQSEFSSEDDSSTDSDLAINKEGIFLATSR